MLKFDFKSVLIGIFATVASGLILQGILTVSGKNPKTEVAVDYLPFIAPPEFGKIFRPNTARRIASEELKNATPPLAISDGNWDRIFQALGVNDVAKFDSAGSIYRLTISNRGALSEKDVRIWIKDAISYYRKSESRLIREELDKDGYVNLPQVNPGENFEILAFSKFYFLSRSLDENIRAFSNSGTIPIYFSTLKPTLFSQLTDFEPLFFATLMAAGIAGIISLLSTIIPAIRSTRTSAEPPSEPPDEEKDG